jgi:hypothetical protein
MSDRADGGGEFDEDCVRVGGKLGMASTLIGSVLVGKTNTGGIST